MRDVLGLLHKRSEASRAEWSGEVPYEQSVWAKYTKELDKLLPGALGLSYWYMLDALDLTEHGCSVGGSWLTDKGKDLLALLSDRDLEEAMSDENHVLLGQPIPR